MQTEEEKLANLDSLIDDLHLHLTTRKPDGKRPRSQEITCRSGAIFSVNDFIEELKDHADDPYIEITPNTIVIPKSYNIAPVPTYYGGCETPLERELYSAYGRTAERVLGRQANKLSRVLPLEGLVVINSQRLINHPGRSRLDTDVLLKIGLESNYADLREQILLVEVKNCLPNDKVKKGNSYQIANLVARHELRLIGQAVADYCRLPVNCISAFRAVEKRRRKRGNIKKRKIGSVLMPLNDLYMPKQNGGRDLRILERFITA